MKGSSKVIMGATMVMIVSVATLLGLILILLAELYCSLLLRRRRKPRNSNSAVAGVTAEQRDLVEVHPGAPTLSNFYAQGVLNVPKNLLFPSVISRVHGNVDLERQHSGLLEFSGSPSQEITTSSPRCRNLAPPKLVYDEVCGGKETYVYICNPIYDNDANRPAGRAETPFETPDSSPSRLETDGSSSSASSGEEDKHDVSVQSVCVSTPPLTPMKKLPAEAASVSLRDAGSLPTSGSESNSIHEGVSSLLSSASPCTTSPSW